MASMQELAPYSSPIHNTSRNVSKERKKITLIKQGSGKIGKKIHIRNQHTSKSRDSRSPSCSKMTHRMQSQKVIKVKQLNKDF
jgi:hypothetical protein